MKLLNTPSSLLISKSLIAKAQSSPPKTKTLWGMSCIQKDLYPLQVKRIPYAQSLNDVCLAL